MELKVNSGKQAGLCVACLSHHAFNGLCDPCQRELPVNRWHCRACALPLPFATDKSLCGDCLTSAPPFSASHIPWRYQFPVDAMIHRYKYNGQRKFARPLIAGLGQYLTDHLTDNPHLRPDALVPAPMDAHRRRRRGFNQALDIAEQIGQALDLPVASGLVRRTRRVRAQRELSRSERLENLRGVFEICAEVPANIAIIDDVVTTGATVRTLAAQLRDHGARDIQVWAIARTPG